MQGREVEIEATNIAHGGFGVARLDGRVIFVADAIPGERVRARIFDDRKKSFWRADTIEVLEPSPHRRAHLWAEADVSRDPGIRPGGADFGHIAPAHQRALKAHVVADSLKRMGGIEREVTVEAVDGPADGGGWRTRERLHVAEDGTVGPYAARTHRVIKVADLPLGTPELREVAPFEQDAPGIGIDEPEDQAPERAFPAARLADEPEGLAALEVEGDAVDGADAGPLAGEQPGMPSEGLAQPAQGEERRIGPARD